MNWEDPTPARVQRVAQRMRHQDRLEVLYSHHWSPEEALRESMARSSIQRCICGDNGQAVGICGVAQGTVIWLLATDELLATASHRRQFIRGAKEWVDGLLASNEFEVLENWVLASNTVALRWLKHLGFKVDVAAPLGRSAQLFCHVWRAI